MRRTVNLLLTLALATFPLACDDDSSDDSGSAGSGGATGGAGGGNNATGSRADLEAYLSAYDQAECDRDQRCEAEPSHDDAAACVAELAADMATQTTRLNRLDSVDAGTLLFYPSVGAEVVTMLEGSCDTSFLDILTKNAEAFEGQVELGGDCRGHYECSDEGISGTGPFCFNGCDGFFGEENRGLNGTCVETSPIGTPECP
ncbi:MAG: hypothetical protein ACE366_24645 [Bradymonadia bacterium]